MRNTLVTTLSASMFGLAAMVAMPSDAKSQVVIIIGNGAAQPYYAAPSPPPYPYPHVLYGAGFYPGYGSYGAFGGGYGYPHGDYGGGYYSPY